MIFLRRILRSHLSDLLTEAFEIRKWLRQNDYPWLNETLEYAIMELSLQMVNIRIELLKAILGI